MHVNMITIRCRNCGHTTETTDRSMVDQPCAQECRGTYRRVWEPVGIAFKGAGFTR